MSRTYRHTKPEYVYRTDDDGWLLEPDWNEVSKHFDSHSHMRFGSRLRNRQIRRDKSFRFDFDNYNVPKPKTGWWAD